MAETKTPTVTGPKVAHTPLPWRVNNTSHNRHWVLRDDKDHWAIARCEIGIGTEEIRTAQANAELIVRAVNSHQDLLDACKEAWTSYGRNGDLSVDALQKLEAAIQKAERPAE